MGNRIPAKELLTDFHCAVDDYIELCASEGKEPEKPYKGSFFGAGEMELFCCTPFASIRKLYHKKTVLCYNYEDELRAAV